VSTLAPVFTVPAAPSKDDECEAWGGTFPTHLFIEDEECARCGACEKCGQPEGEHDREELMAGWKVIRIVVTCPKTPTDRS
jgi:hypothetical protein